MEVEREQYQESSDGTVMWILSTPWVCPGYAVRISVRRETTLRLPALGISLGLDIQVVPAVSSNPCPVRKYIPVQTRGRINRRFPTYTAYT